MNLDVVTDSDLDWIEDIGKRDGWGADDTIFRLVRAYRRLRLSVLRQNVSIVEANDRAERAEAELRDARGRLSAIGNVLSAREPLEAAATDARKGVE